MNYLLEHEILVPVNSSDELTKGTIIRRVSKVKDQQVFSWDAMIQAD